MKGIPGEVVLGRYKIEFRLGQGGFGRIYLAKQIAFGRQVAIKVANPSFSKNKEMRERFLREAVLVSAISHPSVVTYYDFGEDEDHDLILVMEYLHGMSLRELLDKGKVLSLTTTAKYAAEAAYGLAEAHRKGIVHRDIKPSNLFIVAPQTREERLKVIDFGILWVDPKIRPGLPRLTANDMVIGTPEYLPPEVLLGRTPDGRSDQYSLALTVYEMLSGKKPFSELSQEQALMERVTSRPCDLMFVSAGREIPPKVARVLYQALSPDPDERFPSIDMFGDAILEASGLKIPDVHDEKTVIAEPSVVSTYIDPTVINIDISTRKKRPIYLILISTLILAITLVLLFVLRNFEKPPETIKGSFQKEVQTQIHLQNFDYGLSKIPRRLSVSMEESKTDITPLKTKMVAKKITKQTEKTTTSKEPSIIIFNAIPWADLTVDNISYGRTPKTITLEPGKHTVRLSHPSLGIKETTIVVPAGERMVKTFDLQSHPP